LFNYCKGIMGLFNYLKSTILSKVVMAVTGIIIVLFLIGHSLGNLQLFLGRDTFNNYAHFLQSLAEMLWAIRIFLFICLVLHIISSVRVKLLNMHAKPTKYHVKNFMKATLSARTMMWTGVIIGLGLTYHILHFTAGVTNPDQYNHEEYYNRDASLLAEYPKGEIMYEGKAHAIIPDVKVTFKRHDVYKMVVEGFHDPLISFIYIVWVIILGFHLAHAIQSFFQTLGWNHPKYFNKIVTGSNYLAFIIVLCYILVPILILLRVAGGGV
jgi:succinate dehydrogenase / fumarate reductase, cytochrome b subunit